MRTIKFRGKNLYGEWVCGFYVEEERQTINGFEKKYFIVNDGYDYVKPDTVGQFTGLYDKDGKEIYEGDIYRYENPDSINEVCYCIGGGFAGFDFAPAYHDENKLLNVEIIGNIHDNLELLTNE